MSSNGRAQLRRSQVITTYGPGALLDLPRHSVVVGGIDRWRTPGLRIEEPRLARRIQAITGVDTPQLHSPPPEPRPGEKARWIPAYPFPEWFVVSETSSTAGNDNNERSRRLVRRAALDDRDKFDGKPVVPTRFVRACPRGHVDDLDWHYFAHGGANNCLPTAELRLVETGTSGDLGDLRVRCECGKGRPLHDAVEINRNPLGICRGRRPWLGPKSDEYCTERSRLLIRTGSNAWFPQLVSALSLPDHGAPVDRAVAECWADLQYVEDAAELSFVKKKPEAAETLAGFPDAEVLAAIQRRKSGGEAGDRPVKQVELEAILAAPEGFGDDIPPDPNFHARRLPEHIWRKNPCRDGIASVVQLHRLREVLALIGFTRLEAPTPNIHGEYETDVERAQIAPAPSWFPAVENRGEGVFVEFAPDAVGQWLAREPVEKRGRALEKGHDRWNESRKPKASTAFPGTEYVLLHTFSHLLIQALAMRCGYPASSIRERIYIGDGRYGVLLYTASPDAAGTLGGLVQQARHFELHLGDALRRGELCSNDPICARHDPGAALEERWRHGAACHGCALISETSCEMRNDYLDRALVTPVLGCSDAAFFKRI